MFLISIPFHSIPFHSIPFIWLVWRLSYPSGFFTCRFLKKMLKLQNINSKIPTETLIWYSNTQHSFIKLRLETWSYRPNVSLNNMVQLHKCVQGEGKNLSTNFYHLYRGTCSVACFIYDLLMTPAVNVHNVKCDNDLWIIHAMKETEYKYTRRFLSYELMDYPEIFLEELRKAMQSMSSRCPSRQSKRATLVHKQSYAVPLDRNCFPSFTDSWCAENCLRFMRLIRLSCLRILYGLRMLYVT
jgi:hypothetical protein